jgi:hypothetical protein
MPYIKEEDREELDRSIDQLTNSIYDIKHSLDNPHDFSIYLGRINYCFSRILGGLMGSPSYTKVAMITGVLENIKQEFYRRVAEPYEDKKIVENGDIKEYKRLK